MRNLGRVTAVLATLAGASAAMGAFLAGCGGDDTIGNPDASDGSQDTTSDHTAPPDGRADVTHEDHHTNDVQSNDVVTDAGDGGTDASDAKDSGSDSPDVLPDVVTDSPMFFDVGDAGFDVADVFADAPFEVSLAQFPAAVNTAYCQRLAACCTADGGTGDAGAFVANCLGSFAGYSAAGNLNLASTSSPNVIYVTAKAEQCLEQLAATPCGTVSAGKSELNYLTCAEAIQGTLGVGTSGCTSTFDCTSGYCPTDGGTCTALSGVGGPCSDTTYSTDCTYEGNGDPLVYCSPDAGTCQSDLPTDAGGGATSACFEYEQCQSQVCDFSGGPDGGPACVNSFIFADPEYCAVFK